MVWRANKQWDGDELTPNVALVVAGVVGSMVFNIIPFFVGVISEHLDFSEKQVGVLASADMGGMFFAAIAAAYWIRNWNWKYIFGLCGVLLLATNVLTIFVQSSFIPLMLTRIVAGVAGGSLMALGMTGLGDARNPDRWLGVFVTSQAVVGAFSAWLIPRHITDFGVGGLMVYLSVYALIAFGFLKALPASSHPINQELRSGRVSIGLAIASLAGAFVFGAGTFAVWSYLERIGNASGLSPVVIGDSIASAFVVAIVGSLVSTAIAGRYARVWPITVIAAAQLVVLYLLVGHTGTFEFAAAAMLIAFLWYFSVPFQVGITVDVDPTGRFVVLFLMAIKASYAIGPAFVGQFIEGDSYEAVIVFGLVSAVLAYLIYMPLALLAPGKSARTSSNMILDAS